MMTLFWTLLASFISITGMLYLRHVNTKRRRVFKLSESTVPARPVLGWLGVLAPLFILIITGDMAALIVWLAIITLAGWLIAFQKPPQLTHRKR